jgi:hypothetical protein
MEETILQKSLAAESRGIKNLNKETKISSQKKLPQEKWEEVREEIKNAADAEGHRIDEGIKEPIIALNALEINTVQSCEGHDGFTESGKSAPWIRISAPNQPEEKFIGQNDAFEKVAKKYNMSVETVKKMDNADAYWEAMHDCSKNGETSEFKKWAEESERLLYTVKEVLNDFYESRRVPENVKIKVDAENPDDMPEGSFQIFNGGDDYRDISDIELSDGDRMDLGKRIEAYRGEMKEFADFLKDKFFQEGPDYILKIRRIAQEEIDQNKILKLEKELK